MHLRFGRSCWGCCQKSLSPGKSRCCCRSWHSLHFLRWYWKSWRIGGLTRLSSSQHQWLRESMRRLSLSSPPGGLWQLKLAPKPAATCSELAGMAPSKCFDLLHHLHIAADSRRLTFRWKSFLENVNQFGWSHQQIVNSKRLKQSCLAHRLLGTQKASWR